MFITSLAALTLGWLPKFSKVVYVYLGFCFTVNYFGSMVDIPEWISNISIISWIPQMPVEELEILTFIFITVLSMILMVFGYVGYSKRGMIEGA